MNYSNKIKGKRPETKRIEVKQPYLIQRARAGEFNTSLKTGDYLKLDYMGSSEFEWGAIPAYQRRLHAKLDSLEVFEIEHKGITLFMLCSPADANAYGLILKDLIEDKIRLKESSHLTRLFGEYASDTDTWLDLTNDLAFSRHRITLENLRVTVPNSIMFMDSQARKST